MPRYQMPSEGGKLESISASGLRAAINAGEKIESGWLPQKQSRPRKGVSTQTVLAVNETDNDIPIYGIAGVHGPMVTPSWEIAEPTARQDPTEGGDDEEFFVHNAVTLRRPSAHMHWNSIAIAQAPIDKGDTGPVLLSGVSRCRVRFPKGTHNTNRAGFENFITSELHCHDGGMFLILWKHEAPIKDSEGEDTDDYWCLVRFESSPPDWVLCLAGGSGGAIDGIPAFGVFLAIEVQGKRDGTGRPESWADEDVPVVHYPNWRDPSMVGMPGSLRDWSEDSRYEQTVGFESTSPSLVDYRPVDWNDVEVTSRILPKHADHDSRPWNESPYPAEVAPLYYVNGATPINGDTQHYLRSNPSISNSPKNTSFESASSIYNKFYFMAYAGSGPVYVSIPDGQGSPTPIRGDNWGPIEFAGDSASPFDLGPDHRPDEGNEYREKTATFGFRVLSNNVYEDDDLNRHILARREWPSMIEVQLLAGIGIEPWGAETNSEEWQKYMAPARVLKDAFEERHYRKVWVHDFMLDHKSDRGSFMIRTAWLPKGTHCVAAWMDDRWVLVSAESAQPLLARASP